MLSMALLGFCTFLSPHASRAKGFSRFSYALPSAGKQRPRAAPWFIPEPLWSGLSSSHHHRTHMTLWRPSFFWSNCKLLLYPLPPLRVSNWEAWSCPMEFFNHSNRQLYQGKLCWKPDHSMKYPASFGEKNGTTHTESHPICVPILVMSNKFFCSKRAFNLFYSSVRNYLTKNLFTSSL